MNSEIHNINTSYNSNFRHPHVNLTAYKNETYNPSIKVFNYLPTNIKYLSHNVKRFRLSLKDFIHLHSFHTLEKYFDRNINLWT